ncbi:MAG: CopG family transcriptional regulator [Lachnospiraceae bacterium]|nr:CopG family transcriptional regulator [Lachnospiraceae bacterium]
MATITLRVNEKEDKYIKEYVKINNYNLSSFIRDLVLDRIEEDLEIDEDRILKAKKSISNQKKYSYDEIKKELGL